MKRFRDFLILFLIIFSTFFFLMMTVNTFSARPTYQKQLSKCTRYCENHGCIREHIRINRIEFLIPFYNKMSRVYDWNIKILSDQKLVGYKEINIFVYVIIWPLIMLILTYLAIQQHISLKNQRQRIPKNEHAQ